jgi:UDP-N-acetylmuramate--alanine ligase
MAIAWLCGVKEEELRQNMSSFRGVERRFDFKLKSISKVYLSDYAHHPAEIRQSARSIRELYAGRKITAIFQPHLYTRTRDFAPEFAEALSKVDRLILLDIYPARELPIPGVTSEIIFNDVTAPEKVLMKKEELLEWVREQKLEGKELFMTLGAGDIDRLVGPIGDILNEKHNSR